MALKLDPVRMLIADDVGIGKTVEACVIARELLDRGEIRRFSVLCPPHLAEQWQRELMDKFHIDAELVLSGTAARLERTCLHDEAIFERYPFTVVSTDFIKSERRKDSFLRTCPELVIVDEAHTCSASVGRAGQKRHELLQALATDENRHMLLVTATPHSGKSEAFRSLLTLIDRELADLPEDLSGDRNRKHRELLSRYCVQRRRGGHHCVHGRRDALPSACHVGGYVRASRRLPHLFRQGADLLPGERIRPGDRPPTATRAALVGSRAVALAWFEPRRRSRHDADAVYHC